ncbi:T9SS type A sorting domain-containing protein [Botryobacter ruber]|uniref:T9SS type A sorting domain-containing protein n=1 Tax=Botryobacter ruber TaxID=2171629 RepID=UPI0013E2C0DC|nr:T9SS type A sorting domain-containing protein [Botryobacter ruber]
MNEQSTTAKKATRLKHALLIAVLGISCTQPLFALNVDGNDEDAFVSAAATTSTTTWKGTSSTMWENAGNWTDGVPNANKQAVINSGTPVITSAVTAKGVTIAAGATLTVYAQLSLTGDLINNGTLNAIETVVFHGTAAIGGTSSTAFQTLTVANGATLTLNSPVSVAKTLTLVGNLNSDGKLRLLSDGTATANVVGNNYQIGNVTGNVTVERYINPILNSGLGYRHYASPVSGAKVSGLATTGFTPVVNPAYNTAVNTATLTPFPNVFGYNESRLTGTGYTSDFDYGWFSPATTDDVLQVGRGYTVNIAASEKVSFTGTLNNGNIDVELSKGAAEQAGWHLLGNPYASSIEWDALYAAQPLLGGAKSVEAAIYVSRSTGEYEGDYISFVNGIGNASVNTIAAMQAFFVRATAPVTFTFTNAARSSNSAHFFRTTADVRPQLQLNLKDSQGLADEAYIYFQQEATTAVNGEFDAYKVQTYSERKPMLFAKLGKDAMAIKGLPLNNVAQSLPLEFYVPKAGSYTFSVAKLVNFPAGAQVQLYDKETKQSHALSQDKEITLSLSPSTDPHRFVLNFSAVAGSPLSVGQLTAAGVEAMVYPNPSKGDIHLLLSGLEARTEAVEVVLYNMLGQPVLERRFSAAEAQAGVRLEAAGLAGGVYHLQVVAGGKKLTKKVVLDK